ncbi:MAG: group 1 truncated hemoglobin [Myxococcota bacterium]
MSDFERIGGERALRAIVDEFVDRCFDDLMIGFMFRRARRERVKTFEYQHAAAHLGGPGSYEGRPLTAAHAAHRIMGGQFLRRLTILREVLETHGVPGDVREGWLTYHESLRSEVTADVGSECR